MIGAYENLMEEMNRMVQVADAYSEKKHQSLDGDFTYERSGNRRALVDMELINGLNGEVLKDLEDLSPIPKAAKPLDILGRSRQINRRNGEIIAAVKEQQAILDSAEASLKKPPTHSAAPQGILRSTEGL